MAKAGELVVSLGMDTVSFNKKISEVNSKIKLTQSEFKNATTGLKDFEKTSSGLSSKVKELTDKQTLLSKKTSLYKDEIKRVSTGLKDKNKTLEEAKTKVHNLEQAYEKSKRELGENAKETKELKAQLNNANKELSAAEKNVLSTENNLTKLKTQLNNTESELKQVNGELEETSKKLKNANWTEFGEKAKRAGDTLTNIGKKFSVASVALTGIGVSGVKTAATFESAMSQVAATMGMTAEEVNNGSESYKKLEKAAMDMGAKTMFSASQSAEALKFRAAI